MSGEKFKRITMADRRMIEEGLRKHMSIGNISKMLGKTWNAIAYEIKNSRVSESTHYRVISDKNLCVHRDECLITELCRIDCVGMSCAKCRSQNCNAICESFRHVGECPKLKKAPFVCNSCDDRLTILCRYENKFYDANLANERAEYERMRARTGVDCTEEQLIEMVRLVKPLMKKGQSLRHIWNTHAEELPVSMRTFYRYIEYGVLDICNLDLPKRVKYKPRMKRRRDEVPFRPNLAGRMYKDFQVLDEQMKINAVEMDCVESGRGCDKTILTLYFRRTCFQIMVMMPDHTQGCVVEVLDMIESLCGPDEFVQLFGTILTDRGHEFMDFDLIERSAGGGRRCHVYYCDPLQSGQKGACEKNHVELRKILPKGTSFKNISNYELSVICSHVNSYTRDALGGASPFDLAEKILPMDLLEGLAIKRIPPDDVIMRPSLLRELGLK